MVKKWICTVCNYVHEGPEPPDVCPVCGVGREMFVPYSEQEPGADAGSERDGDGEPQTLEQVRDRARDLLRGICAVYPHCNGGSQNICQREAYGHPIGLGGAGRGLAFRANVEALERIRLRTRLVGPHFEPRTRFDFFGQALTMPIMGASTSGVGRYHEAIDEAGFCRAHVEGCREAGTISWRGDTFFYTEDDHPGLDSLEAAGGAGVQIFKPRAQDSLKRLFARAERVGCPAVGVDLDGCGSTNFARAGQPVYRKSPAELRELVSSTGLPVIFKGIMDPEDAEACLEAGARAIAVSNHGGRVLDSTPGVAEVLPAVVERVGGGAMVVADGGVRTGYDVLKLLALGADAVLVGRDLVRAAVGGGAAGVRMQMERLGRVLAKAMLMTGNPDLAAIDAQTLEPAAAGFMA